STGNGIRQTFDYPLKPGYGYCITTYNPGSVQLNTFEGEPFIVPVRGNTEEVMERFWNSLEPKWRVALCGKSIEGSQIYTAKNININVQKKR
ncbi:MAG: hypothetical protein NT001_01445, partial [Candidatus Woesearchaeota archaeon]|nr:hypothetical protein [Candidatus Woesearchaeota archaeon]